MSLPKVETFCVSVCLTLCALGSFPLCSAQTTLSPAEASDLFDFHSGFWINLHLFLYQQAVLSQPQRSPHSLSLTIADSEELQRLSLSERTSWNDAVSYYGAWAAKRDLLFDDELIMTKNELEDCEDSADLRNAKIPAETRTMLLEAATIYGKHWWARHNAENRRWIAQIKPAMKQYGSTLAARMIKIYAQPWPQYPVRVDAVAYANWAGAYTTLYPTRPTISTTDADNQGTAALEILFHETSHGMMDKVTDAIRASEANLNAHRSGEPFHSGSIWHAVLFYTAGELVAEQIPGYIPYADKNGLWVRAWPSPDRSLIEQDWKPHMNGSLELQPALAKLVMDLGSVSASK